jgi:TolB-like protein
MSLFFIYPYVVLARQSLDEGINALTEQINKYMVEQKKTKIAIIPFPDIQKQKVNVFGSFIAEELTTNLFTTGKFKIVERSLLRQVLDELKLGQTGIVDANSAKELGKLTGVDAIIAGTITDLGSTIAINCRLIETQSGEVFAAAKTRIAKNSDLEKMLVDSNDINTPKMNDQKQAETKKDNTYSLPSTIESDYKFEITSCQKSGQRITIDFKVTLLDENGEIRLSADWINITDNNGNVYKASRLNFGTGTSRDYTSFTTPLAKNVPTKGTVVFNASEQSDSIALIDIRFRKFWSATGRGGAIAQIKNIPIRSVSDPEAALL